jgi:hypothetical protein
MAKSSDGRPILVGAKKTRVLHRTQSGGADDYDCFRCEVTGAQYVASHSGLSKAEWAWLLCNRPKPPRVLVAKASTVPAESSDDDNESDESGSTLGMKDGENAGGATPTEGGQANAELSLEMEVAEDAELPSSQVEAGDGVKSVAGEQLRKSEGKAGIGGITSVSGEQVQTSQKKAGDKEKSASTEPVKESEKKAGDSEKSASGEPVQPSERKAGDKEKCATDEVKDDSEKPGETGNDGKGGKGEGQGDLGVGKVDPNKKTEKKPVPKQAADAKKRDLTPSSQGSGPRPKKQRTDAGSSASGSGSGSGSGTGAVKKLFGKAAGAPPIG